MGIHEAGEIDSTAEGEVIEIAESSRQVRAYHLVLYPGFGQDWEHEAARDDLDMAPGHSADAQAVLVERGGLTKRRWVWSCWGVDLHSVARKGGPVQVSQKYYEA